ncbi:MAG: SseB family protein [Myxococcales bacterium]|nr:SseB family protein [Myxococcales bacterium]
MSFKPFDSGRNPPENAPLRKAIAKLSAEPTPENRAAVHAGLTAGPLLIALRELPKEVGPDPQALTGDIPIQFVTSKAPGGAPVLAAFTDAEAVAKRAPAGVWLGVAPLELLNWIVEEGFEGLMLNPEGPSAYISRDAVLRLLGMEDRVPRSGRSLSISKGPENAIRDALTGLQEDAHPPAFVIAREPRTGKSVRFSPEADGALRMDLTAAELDSGERTRAQLMFDELAGGADDLPPQEQGPEAEAPAAYVAIFAGDVGRAAKAAVKVFTWVFGFPPNFELRIEAH